MAAPQLLLFAASTFAASVACLHWPSTALREPPRSSQTAQAQHDLDRLLAGHRRRARAARQCHHRARHRPGTSAAKRQPVWQSSPSIAAHLPSSAPAPCMQMPGWSASHAWGSYPHKAVHAQGCRPITGQTYSIEVSRFICRQLVVRCFILYHLTQGQMACRLIMPPPSSCADKRACAGHGAEGHHQRGGHIWARQETHLHTFDRPAARH